MLGTVIVLVLAASVAAVSPQRPTCGMNLRPPPPRPTYPITPPRIPYYPGDQTYSPYYNTGGYWMCYYLNSGYYPYYGYGAGQSTSYPSPYVQPRPGYPTAPVTLPAPIARPPAPMVPYPQYRYPMPGMPTPTGAAQQRKVRSAPIHPEQAMAYTTSSSQAEQPSTTTINSPNTSTQKIEVSIVFSTANTNVPAAFTHQLYPAVHALGTHITLDLLPHTEGGCQSRSGECAGGSLVMCATEVLPDPAMKLAFSACLVQTTLSLDDQSYPAVMNAAKMCMGPYSADWMQMAECVTSGRGETLFEAAAKRLNHLDLGPQNPPIVALNQMVVITDARTLSYFPALLCHQLSHTPEATAYCPYYPQIQ